MEQILVGDKVRSFDFPDNRKCYMDGVVEEVGKVVEGCPRYTIRVTRCIWNGRTVECYPDYVYPPVNGTPNMLGGDCNFVERIGLAPGDRIIKHYCGGSDIAVVLRVNKKSVRCKQDSGNIVTYKRKDVTLYTGEVK